MTVPMWLAILVCVLALPGVGMVILWAWVMAKVLSIWAKEKL